MSLRALESKDIQLPKILCPAAVLFIICTRNYGSYAFLSPEFSILSYGTTRLHCATWRLSGHSTKMLPVKHDVFD
eukprot:scaffold46018_cov34-Prasinocladus_malaysianus.AAC.3